MRRCSARGHCGSAGADRSYGPQGCLGPAERRHEPDREPRRDPGSELDRWAASSRRLVAIDDARALLVREPRRLVAHRARIAVHWRLTGKRGHYQAKVTSSDGSRHGEGRCRGRRAFARFRRGRSTVVAARAEAGRRATFLQGFLLVSIVFTLGQAIFLGLILVGLLKLPVEWDLRERSDRRRDLPGRGPRRRSSRHARDALRPAEGARGARSRPRRARSPLGHRRDGAPRVVGRAARVLRHLRRAEAPRGHRRGVATDPPDERAPRWITWAVARFGEPGEFEGGVLAREPRPRPEGSRGGRAGVGRSGRCWRAP